MTCASSGPVDRDWHFARRSRKRSYEFVFFDVGDEEQYGTERAPTPLKPNLLERANSLRTSHVEKLHGVRAQVKKARMYAGGGALRVIEGETLPAELIYVAILLLEGFIGFFRE